LQRSGFGGGSGDDNGVLHGIVLLEGLDKLCDGRSLLANGNVDAVKLLRLVLSIVPSLLVKNGIEGNSGLAGLTITNDQLTLSTSNWYHGIDGLETSLYGLVDGVSRKNTWGLKLGTTLLGSLDGSLAINGVSKSINDTTEHFNSDWNIDNLSGTLDGLSLLDQTIGTEEHNTNLSSFQVHAHSLDTGGELDKLLGLDVGHTVNTSDTITDRQNTSSLGQTGLLLHTSNSLLENGRDLCW
jgi:hypothetical protein